MRHLLQIYTKEIPILTADLTIQNTIQSYLMMSELEVEIRRTWFYKVFPNMKMMGYSNSISGISEKLHYQLRNLETYEGYTRLNSQLSFGKTYTFLNMNFTSLVDIIESFPNAIIRKTCKGVLIVRCVGSSGGHLSCGHSPFCHQLQKLLYNPRVQ